MVIFRLFVIVVIAAVCAASDTAVASKCGVKPDVFADAIVPPPVPAPIPALAAGKQATKNAATKPLVPTSSDESTPGTVAAPKAQSPATGSGSPNWVGPQVGEPIDSACFRKSYMTTKKQCATGYNFDGALTCWTQCPIEYPVECGMECLPQNKDCTKQILTKVTSVATVALNAVTGGVFGSLAKAGKLVKTGVKCGQQLFSVVQRITEMVDEVENGDAGTTTDATLFAISKADFVVYDLPAAVATCIGVPVPKGLNKAQEVTGVAQQVVDMAVTSQRNGVNLKDFGTFLNLTKSIVPTAAASIEALPEADASSLQRMVTSGATCGMDLNSVTNKIIAMVQDMKTVDPASTVDVIKFAVLNSDVVLNDLPAAATSCTTAAKRISSREAAAAPPYPSRDAIIKTVHTMIDGVVDASSKDDKPVSNADFGISVANMGLDAIATLDPTGIAAMAAEFVQPICGPTAYVGDIDSGAADQALGLNAVEKAFRGSTGTWAKTGDGQLKITFTSVDDKDVRVNVLSGGKKLYEVPVKKGETVEWTKPLSEFQGKTIYMDRWRGGILNLPGTGGGSLMAWVPNNKDGALSLTVLINPTSASDKERRMRR